MVLKKKIMADFNSIVRRLLIGALHCGMQYSTAARNLSFSQYAEFFFFLLFQDVTSNPKLCSLLDHKYVVHLTDQAYSYLLRYLQSDDNSAICWALSTHVQVWVAQNAFQITNHSIQ